MGLTGDPKLDTPPDAVPQEGAGVREFIASGKAVQEKYISVKEIEASAGNAHIDAKEDGWNIRVDKGSVVGWMWLKIQNLQDQLMSQQGLLHAAGMQVQQMRMAMAQLQGGEQTEAGLIVPPPGARIPQAKEK